jgi:plastocyanin
VSRRTRSVTVQVLLVVGLVACGGDDGGSGEEAGGTSPSSSATSPAETPAADADDGSGQVDIVDFRFEPADVTVAVGTTVRWENKDDAVHSVADRALDVESEDLAQRDTFERTYDEPGQFPYVCGIHDYMEGTVTVE